MNDAVVVKILQGENQFCKVHLGEVGGKGTSDVLEERGHVAPLDKLHHETKALLGLEGAVETDDEGIVRKG